MLKLSIHITEESFSSLSREALRVLRYMAEKWPEKKVFYTDELGEIVKLQGRELGGILSSFSKKEGEPLVVKIGTSMVGWRGQEFSRPKQVWALNPRLEEEGIQKIRNILTHFLLDIRVEKIDEFDSGQHYYRLTHFSGDNTYVITKFKKSNTIVRGDTIFTGNNRDESLKYFDDLKNSVHD